MEKVKEIFRDIPGFDGVYQVSNLGNVKSFKCNKERILKPGINSAGYYNVSLYSGTPKSYRVHKLVAITFLNHKPCWYESVIDHINNDKLDNRISNLQIISHRENTSKNKKDYTSNYIGVCYHKSGRKWKSSISINGKHIYLGLFDNEIDAAEMYQKAFKNIDKYKGDTNKFRNLLNL